MCEHESWDRSEYQKNGNLTSAEQSASFCKMHSERSEGCVRGGTQTVNKRIQRVFDLVLRDISLINVGEKVGHISVSLWSLILPGSIVHWGMVAPLLSMINLKGSAFLII